MSAEACQIIMSNGDSTLERCGDVLRLITEQPPVWFGLIDWAIRVIALIGAYSLGRRMGRAGA